MIVQYIPTALNSLKSESARRNYARWMRHFNEWYEKAAKDQPITYDLIVAYLTSLEADFSPASRAQALAAVKHLISTIHKSNREAVDLYTYTIINGIKPVKHKPELAGQMIPDKDIKALLEACRQDSKPAGLRDASIIALLHSTGMRRDEAASLTLEDYDSKQNKVILRDTKNDEDRISFLNDGAIWHLENWLSLRSLGPGPIYWRTKRGGDLWIGKGISGSAIYNIIQTRCGEAGIESYKPHDFRRTLISNLLKDFDIALVSRIAGHHSAAMTARYDRRDDEEMRRAIKKIYTPFA